jgi:uncharacterized YccA/Bax inhibitor family protein
MRTANPALRDDVFTGLYTKDRSNAMTFQGVVNKTAILFILMLIAAGWTWSLSISAKNPGLVGPLMIGGAIVGLILAIATAVKPVWSAILAPLYALCQGLFIGGISATFEAAYPGIVLQAASLTFGTLAVLLAVYKTGVIQVSDNFRLGIVAATGGIALVYFVSIILSMFGITVPFIQGSGLFSIIFSVIVVIVAAMNLILDFDFIERGVNRGLPRYMEWYGAFALMVTLIWLYIEMLRLLSKVRDR